jgi:hypothetical protein
MKNTTQMIKGKLGFSSIYRRIFGFLFLLLLPIFHSQIFQNEDPDIFVQGKAIVVSDDSMLLKKENAIIYIVNNAAIVNHSQQKNYEIIYTSHKNKKLNNYKLCNNIVNKKVIQIKKIISTKTKNIEEFYFKKTSNQKSYCWKLKNLNPEILTNSNPPNYKHGILGLLSFNQLPFFAEEIKSNIHNNSIKNFSYTKFFFTRPPPIKK